MSGNFPLSGATTIASDGTATATAGAVDILRRALMAKNQLLYLLLRAHTEPTKLAIIDVEGEDSATEFGIVITNLHDRHRDVTHYYVDGFRRKNNPVAFAFGRSIQLDNHAEFAEVLRRTFENLVAAPSGAKSERLIVVAHGVSGDITSIINSSGVTFPPNTEFIDTLELWQHIFQQHQGGGLDKDGLSAFGLAPLPPKDQHHCAGNDAMFDTDLLFLEIDEILSREGYSGLTFAPVSAPPIDGWNGIGHLLEPVAAPNRGGKAFGNHTLMDPPSRS